MSCVGCSVRRYWRFGRVASIVCGGELSHDGLESCSRVGGGMGVLAADFLMGFEEISPPIMFWQGGC